MLGQIVTVSEQKKIWMDIRTLKGKIYFLLWGNFFFISLNPWMVITRLHFLLSAALGTEKAPSPEREPRVTPSEEQVQRTSPLEERTET